eukprot:347475-Chlamydomonas_euryale.AAC.4
MRRRDAGYAPHSCLLAHCSFDFTCCGQHVPFAGLYATGVQAVGSHTRRWLEGRMCLRTEYTPVHSSSSMRLEPCVSGRR